MPYPMVDMILYFFAYSFCGWIMETVLCSVQERRFVNRGFLNGPICPIYGCGASLIIIFLIPVRDSIPELFIAIPVIFIAGTGLASAVEFMTSWLMEKLFHARWWDYSHYKYNVGGRICMKISLIWGALATGFVYIVQPLFDNTVSLLYDVNANVPATVAAVILCIMVLDCAASARIALLIGNKLDQMETLGDLIKLYLESLELPSPEAVKQKLEHIYEQYEEKKSELIAKMQARTEEWNTLPIDEWRQNMTNAVAELQAKRIGLMNGTRSLQKRMLIAFPKMKHLTSGVSLNELREYLRKYTQKKK